MLIKYVNGEITEKLPENLQELFQCMQEDVAVNHTLTDSYLPLLEDATMRFKDNFYDTVVHSLEFRKWIEFQRKLQIEMSELPDTEDGKKRRKEMPIFDIDETIECGKISSQHFSEFLKWYKMNV